MFVQEDDDSTLWTKFDCFLALEDWMAVQRYYLLNCILSTFSKYDILLIKKRYIKLRPHLIS